MDNTNMQSNQEITKKKKWLIPVILGVAALLVIGLGVGGFIYIKSVALPKKELQKQLDMGDKYLTDMDYDSAILAYREAISINPKSVDAYLGLGNAYLGLADELVEEGDIEGAIKKLKKGIKELQPGIDETDSEDVKEKQEELKENQEELKEKQDELKEKKESTDNSEKTEKTELTSEDVQLELFTVSINEVPMGMFEFLDDFSWFGEYDCENVSDLEGFMTELLCTGSICDFYLYSNSISEPSYDIGVNYYKEDDIDWLLTNIYNFTKTEIEEVKNRTAYNYGFSGDVYWGIPVGGGNNSVIEIKEIQTDYNKYYVSYDVSFDYDYSGNLTFGGTYYALMEYKILDGIGYWSIYKNSKTKFF